MAATLQPQHHRSKRFISHLFALTATIVRFDWPIWHDKTPCRPAAAAAHSLNVFAWINRVTCLIQF